LPLVVDGTNNYKGIHPAEEDKQEQSNFYVERGVAMTNHRDAESSSAIFRIGVFALIFNHEKQILLGHRRDIDWWNLPGGGMEAGETVDEAICREVFEETGLKVRVEQLIGVYSKPQKQEVVLTFLCEVIGGSLQPTEETRESRYFAPMRFQKTHYLSIASESRMHY
jgi:ADP-ribose pyrophosphatase YjhB (NUDIX family)